MRSSMQSFRQSTGPELPEISTSIPLATELTVSLTTLPLLTLLTVGRLAHHSLTQLGKASEEIFRGDRLPVLPLIEPDL